MKQTISVLVENQAGVLNKITGFPDEPLTLNPWRWVSPMIPPFPGLPLL